MKKAFLMLLLLPTIVLAQPGIGPVTGGARGIRTFSFTNANGFTGTVTNPNTTPSLQLSLDPGAVTLGTIESIASSRVIGRKTSGVGPPEQVTASEVLDMIGNTRGAILYRGASGWSILGPGTANQILISNGAGTDPSWATDVNEKTANKGQANGYASLDGTSKLTTSQVPTTVELTANKGAISGYAPLNSSQFVPRANLGSGGTGGGTKALFDDNVFRTLAGGGSVVDVAVATANGVSAVSDHNSATPALTFTLGAITPTTIVATGAVSGTNLSGTNTGDQTITLTGQVAGSGTGSFAATIATNTVTYSNFQQVNAMSLVGNPTGSLANATNVTIGGGGQLTGGKLKFYNGSAPVSGAAPHADADTAKVFTITLTANTTFVFDNFNDGDSIAIRVKQAGAGGPYTVAFPAANWQGGSQPTQTTTANKVDWYSFLKSSAGIDAIAQQNF